MPENEWGSTLTQKAFDDGCLRTARKLLEEIWKMIVGGCGKNNPSNRSGVDIYYLDSAKFEQLRQQVGLSPDSEEATL